VRQKKRSTGSGRQLLDLKARIRAESDPESRLRLRRKEALLLAQLGNLPEALSRADQLLREAPEHPPTQLLMADLLAMDGSWKKSLDAFLAAGQMARQLGEAGRAEKINLGPCYRIAEGLELLDICSEVVSGYSSRLSAVLRWRLARLGGDPIRRGPSKMPEGHAGGIWLLEACWRGRRQLAELQEAARDWPAAEPEWRWRMVVEGHAIASRAGLSTRRWVRLAREASGDIKDPRFAAERKALLSG
jgi:hypothetical protein